MNKKFYYLSAALFVISVAVHFLTYVLKEYYPVFTLSFVIHGLIFIPFGAMIILNRKRFSRHPDVRGAFPMFEVFKKLIPGINPAAVILINMLFLYVFINFFLCLRGLAGGAPEIADGAYILNNHGTVTSITREEYVSASFTQLRMFSGHWILFSFLPMLSFRSAVYGKRSFP